MTNPTTIRHTPESKTALETIMQRYGLKNESEAVRFALVLVAFADVKLTAPDPRKTKAR